MASEPHPALVFFKFPIQAASVAFSFHCSVAESDPYLRLRSEDEIRTFAAEGELFGVHSASKILAQCYVTLDESANEYEVGGLAVLPEVQQLGVAGILARLAIAHVIANERPRHFGRRIVGYVHQDNQRPRKLMDRLGFQHIGRQTLKLATATMKQNPQGEVVGDKFVFPGTAVKQLCNWFKSEFRNLLTDGLTPVIIELKPGGLQSLIEAVCQEAAEL
jgi:GNAT superfamily N-acetyltransferase